MVNIEAIKEQLDKISNDVIADLKEMVKNMTSNIELYGEIDHVLFHEWEINAPIHTDSSDGNLSETISGMYIQDGTDKLIFTIDTYESGYDVTSDDIILDNLIYIHQNLISTIEDAPDELQGIIEDCIRNGKAGIEGQAKTYKNGDYTLYLYEDRDIWDMEFKETFELGRGQFQGQYYILDNEKEN